MESGSLQQTIKVRQVTHFQPTFTLTTPGEEGSYSFQLILDHGAEEVVLDLTEGDADNLYDWLESSKEAYYDLERGVLMLGTRPIG